MHVGYLSYHLFTKGRSICAYYRFNAENYLIIHIVAGFPSQSETRRQRIPPIRMKGYLSTAGVVVLLIHVCLLAALLVIYIPLSSCFRSVMYACAYKILFT